MFTGKVRRSALTKLAPFLFATSVVVPICSANLITNGDFEMNPVANGAGVILATNDTTSLPGWKVIGACGSNCIGILNNYLEASNLGTLTFQAQSGNQSLDLTGGFNSLVGGVEQTVATSIGANYSLTFYVGNMDNNASSYTLASAVQVAITGQAAQIFSNNTNTTTHLNWALETFDFTATSTSTTIDFINATLLADNEAGLDNVQLNAVSSTVPEPSSMLLLGAGLVAFAFVRRSLR
jgi:hypothetical protein